MKRMMKSFMSNTILEKMNSSHPFYPFFIFFSLIFGSPFSLILDILARVESVWLESVQLESVRLERVWLESVRLESMRLENVRLENMRLENMRLENVRLEIGHVNILAVFGGLTKPFILYTMTVIITVYSNTIYFKSSI